MNLKELSKLETQSSREVSSSAVGLFPLLLNLSASLGSVVSKHYPAEDGSLVSKVVKGGEEGVLVVRARNSRPRGLLT